MKDFMMIFVGSSYEELGLSPEQIQARMGKWFEWANKMEAAGVRKAGNALTPNRTRITGADRVISDGPFVESKEIIGGYYIVSAESKEDVIKIAQDYPDYDLNGAVEIREIMVFDN